MLALRAAELPASVAAVLEHGTPAQRRRVVPLRQKLVAQAERRERMRCGGRLTEIPPRVEGEVN